MTTNPEAGMRLVPTADLERISQSLGAACSPDGFTRHSAGLIAEAKEGVAKLLAAAPVAPAGTEGEVEMWNGLGEPPEGQGRARVSADDPIYKAFKPSREAIDQIEKNERANAQALHAIREMMVGHVTNWPAPKRFGTALSLIDKTLHAALAARAQPPVGEVEWPLRGRVWTRESTNEKVLELEGAIDDTFMVCRHTQPMETPDADVPGLPSLYTHPAEPAARDGGEALRFAALNAAAALEVVGLSEAVSCSSERDLKAEALTVANRLRLALAASGEK